MSSRINNDGAFYKNMFSVNVGFMDIIIVNLQYTEISYFDFETPYV
jgi:hypothetical protein